MCCHYGYLDTKVVLKSTSSDEFETLMLLSESGITLKFNYNGADEVTVPVDGSAGNFRLKRGVNQNI